MTRTRALGRHAVTVTVLALSAVVVLGFLSSCTQEGRDQIKDRISGAVTASPTEAPTESPTEAPTTEAPTTEAPTTEAPTTEAPTEEAATPTPTKTPKNKPAETSDNGGVPWWVWVLAAVGLVVVVGAIALLTVRSRRKRAAVMAWRDRAQEASSLGLALHDRVASELSVPPSAAQAAAWMEIHQMIDRVAADLHWLSTEPPEEPAAREVANLQSTLENLRSGVNVREHAPITDDAAVAAATTTLRGRVADLEGALQRFAAALRGEGAPPNTAT
jgi:type IV secretory pathway VirB10-like protein